MTRGHTDLDDLVQRYLDGELAPGEDASARDLIESDPRSHRAAQDYRFMGDLIREAGQAEALEESMRGAWEAVSGKIAQEGPRGASDPAPARVWLGELVSHRKRYWIPGSAAAVAAAASIVVLLNLPAAPPVPDLAIPDPFGLRSRVTNVSLQAASTLVFEVETAAGGTAAVVWVTADESGEGAQEGTDVDAEDQAIIDGELSDTR